MRITRLQQQLMLVLMVLIWLLLPFGRLAEIPVLILAIWGMLLFIGAFKQRKQLTWFKPLTVLIGLYSLLTLISALDSYWPEKSYTIGFAVWRFYFMAITVLWLATASSREHKISPPKALYSRTQLSELLTKMMALVALLWCLDALLQAVVGYDIFMRTSYPGRLTGIFGDNVKLGPVLALLLPLVLIWVKQHSRWLRWTVFAVVMTVILLSGTRSAWLMAAFVWLLYGWQQLSHARWWAALKAAGLVLLLAVALSFTVPEFNSRIQRSLHIFGGDEAALDFALADRLPIWQTAWQMYQAHPVNGVGARAFRHAYPDYAAVDDPWLAQDGVSLQPHHWLFDLLTETGTLGFMLGLSLMIIYIRVIKNHYRSPHVWPFAVALMAAFLPVVSLYSIFSSFWSICLWWLVIVSLMGVADDKS